MLLPSALGFSPHPPVSVYGTGPYHTIAAFLDGWLTCFATLWFAPHHVFPFWQAVFPPCQVPRLSRAFHSRVRLSTRVTTVLIIRSTGISTCCPSTTAFALALGPDLPRADQLYSGNLGYSAGRILTYLSLLIPAFSLPLPPLSLTVQLLWLQECSSTDHATHDPRASVACFSPGHFRRSTSRPVSYYALF